MRYLQPPLLLLFALLLQLAGPAKAATSGPPKTALPAIHAVTTVAPGQAGYVHYFRITHPDNTLEDQVGIELADQRIAWSFPGAGVIVSDFIKYGDLRINETSYRIEHLHGLRPLKNEHDMRILRNDLARRVAFWVEDETPYCVFRQPGMPFCLNCGDFVARILFPSDNPFLVAFPDDLLKMPGNLTSPDDLLLYMLGLHNLPDTPTRIARLAAMDLPEALRRDALEILTPDGNLMIAATPSPEKKPLPRLATRKPQNRRL